MFIVNPDGFLLPSYRISPFTTKDTGLNHTLPEDAAASNYLNERFGKGNWQYTYNGREAIRLALQKHDLDTNDLVTILTTTENFYISSCVTHEIERFCRWNREVLPETKLIFVNHEFGYVHPEMDKLQLTGLPIIEDCCTTFFSQDENGMVGKYGDHALYSFPKFFPIQLGGILVSNKAAQTEKSTRLTNEEAAYIEKVISHHLKNEAGLLQRRNENFEYAVSAFSELGFTERLPKDKNTVPSALLLRNHSVIKDLNKLKIFLYDNGIQNSVFYGEDAFFIPSHQNLNKSEIDYFSYCIREYLKSYNTIL